MWKDQWYKRNLKRFILFRIFSGNSKPRYLTIIIFIKEIKVKNIKKVKKNHQNEGESGVKISSFFVFSLLRCYQGAVIVFNV